LGSSCCVDQAASLRVEADVLLDVLRRTVGEQLPGRADRQA